MNPDFTDSPDHSFSSNSSDEHFRQMSAPERAAMLKCARESERLKSMGLLAGGVAHDFNNLLTGILGCVELAMEEVSDRPNAKALLENAAEAGRRARDLCLQILNHVQPGEENAPVDLHALVSDAVSLMKTSGKKMEFHLGLSAVPSITHGSTSEFRQMLLNLLTNAAEAVTEGGNIWIDTHHCIVTDRNVYPVDPGDYIMLRIRDDGQGMSQDVQARIFDPFYTTKNNGAGIGLASVARIVSEHGGSVTVDSSLGGGATFTLLLPLAPPEQNEVQPDEPDWRGSGRVLVIDDEEFLVQLIAQVLTNIGFTVDTAGGGQAALTAFAESKEPYVATMLDLTMPGMNGADTLSALREAGMTCPVVLMSGLERSHGRDRIPKHEVAGFLLKPFATKAIVEAIRSVLEPSAFATNEESSSHYR